MECIQIKRLIINKNKKSLISKYKELIKTKKINPLAIDKQIYNRLDYLPEDKRIKMSITINFDNELEYWIWLASPILKEYLLEQQEVNK